MDTSLCYEHHTSKRSMLALWTKKRKRKNADPPVTRLIPRQKTNSVNTTKAINRNDKTLGQMKESGALTKAILAARVIICYIPWRGSVWTGRCTHP